LRLKVKISLKSAFTANNDKSTLLFFHKIVYYFYGLIIRRKFARPHGFFISFFRSAVSFLYRRSLQQFELTGCYEGQFYFLNQKINNG